MLTADFIEFAELDETALYAGIGHSFQICHRAGRSRDNARARAKTDGVEPPFGRGIPVNY